MTFRMMTLRGSGRRGPAIPIIYLGAVLGLGGLGSAWRAAHRVWNVPALVGEGIVLAALVVWLVCGLGFIRAWLGRSETARGDLRDPARAPFAALLPMSTMIAGFALKPHAPMVSGIVVGIGLGCQVLVAVQATASLWRGGRDGGRWPPNWVGNVHARSQDRQRCRHTGNRTRLLRSPEAPSAWT